MQCCRNTDRKLYQRENEEEQGDIDEERQGRMVEGVGSVEEYMLDHRSRNVNEGEERENFFFSRIP